MSNAKQRRKAKRKPLKEAWLAKHRELLAQLKPKEYVWTPKSSLKPEPVKVLYHGTQVETDETPFKASSDV